MKEEYGFSQGHQRSTLDPTPVGKTLVTIRLDNDVLDWFRRQVEEAGGGNYQTLINNALRDYVYTQDQPFEATLRRVLREKKSNYG